ncbi:unnamed protein product [Phytomonas sp. Hart1]|nr:unnamed protein product [Phytomonas sp. Hart1]|eukprot:CCW72126.1 unnamed protein product [Phytomonas sp. isolate Hart1]
MDFHSSTVEGAWTALHGFALEKQLMQRSKDDMVQLILELASCQPEASAFIHSKINFFATQQEMNASMDVEAFGAVGSAPEGTNQAPNSVSSHGMCDDNGSKSYEINDAHQLTSFEGTITNNENVIKPRGASHNQSSDETYLPRALLCENLGTCQRERRFYDSDRYFSKPYPINLSTSQMRQFSDARNNGVISTLATPIAQCSTNRLSITATNTGNNKTTTILKRTQVRSRDKPFCTDLHPCLRWYGVCRNPTKCVYVTTPQNLCLNWIRASCSSGDDCSGVHRLPEPCTFDVFMVYQLNHGMRRHEASSWITSRFSPCIFPKISSSLEKNAMQDAMTHKASKKQHQAEAKSNAHTVENSATHCGDTSAVTPSVKTGASFLHPNRKRSNNSDKAHARKSLTEVEKVNAVSDGEPQLENVYRSLYQSFVGAASSESPNEEPQPKLNTDEDNWREHNAVTKTRSPSQGSKTQQDHPKLNERYPGAAFGIANRSIYKNAIEDAPSAKDRDNKSPDPGIRTRTHSPERETQGVNNIIKNIL